MSEIVGTYGGSDNVVRPLIGLLNDFWKPGAPNPIPEILYIHQMSETGKLPGETFYPRAIITQMISRWKIVQETVHHAPHLVMKYQCQYFDEGEWRVYEFSNIMPLDFDIIVLQYLYIYSMTHDDFPSQLCNLMTLMTNKYVIYEDVNCSACKMNYETCEIICENRNCFRNNPRVLTFGRIYQSYVSVMLWIDNYIPEVIRTVHSIFPNSSFPGMICSWYLFLILPRYVSLDYKFLLAVNLAVCASYYPKFSILSIYRHIIQYFTESHDVYTEYMRRDICFKLGILWKIEDDFCLASNLEIQRCCYYIIAKDSICNIRLYDTTLNETIKQLEQLNTICS